MTTAGTSSTGPDKITVSVARNSVCDLFIQICWFLNNTSVAIIAETSIAHVCEWKTHAF